MGCKQSKAVLGTVKSGSVLSPNQDSKATTNNKNSKAGHHERPLLSGKSSGSYTKRIRSFRNGAGSSQDQNQREHERTDTQETVSEAVSTSEDHVYKLLIDCSNTNNTTSSINSTKFQDVFREALTPVGAAYRSPKSKSTPLHIAVRLLDAPDSHATSSSVSRKQQQQVTKSNITTIVEELLRASPGLVHVEDGHGNIPLHYAIAPVSFTTAKSASSWKTRTAVARLLLSADQSGKSIEYLRRNNVVYLATDDDDENGEDDDISGKHQKSEKKYDIDREVGGCSPLYRAIQTIPDDFSPNSPTLEFLHLLVKTATTHSYLDLISPTSTYDVVGCGNSSDGDKPLALLYRRFTRQFDVSEKFFAGDNSRPEVIEHRTNYKQAAGNTWKIIDLLLQYQSTSSQQSLYEQHENDEDMPEQLQPIRSVNSNSSHYRTVHRAVQGETPPDLLRYIVETNAEDLTVPDEYGNLPLHYAAKSQQRSVITGKNNQYHQDYKAAFPPLYNKYVIDELLYKYPDAASMKDRNGLYPLTLAVQSGKQWIGGGIKSLYDAYPDALKQINLDDHAAIRQALSLDNTYNEEDTFSDTCGGETPKEGEEKIASEMGVVQDELHDAIMLVQQEGVDIAEVVASMWAHEEDAGVQMLGCVAISRLVDAATEKTIRESASISPTSSQMAHTNNMDDVMRIALSSIPAIVNAMKAHPNEVIVQEKACHALKSMAWSDGKREISFVASGGVAAIIGAMQAHVSDPGVQEEACGCIAKIIKYGGPERATVVASVSGLTAIINAIAAHPDVAGIQYNGCRALCELTAYENANLPEIPKSHTQPLLDAAKKKFPHQCAELVDVLLTRLT